MKIEVLNKKGKKVQDMQLSSVFDVELSDKALALYVNYLRNALRGPVANTKDRGDVSGGGRKPYKQKGTGRARQSSTRSPLWVGGGVTFGPTSERNFHTKINKSQKRNAILGLFGQAFANKKAIVIDSLSFDEVKTKNAISILDAVKAEGKVSVILNETDTKSDLCFRNISGSVLMQPNRLSIIDLISSDKVVMSQAGLNKLEEIYSK